MQVFRAEHGQDTWDPMEKKHVVRGCSGFCAYPEDFIQIYNSPCLPRYLKLWTAIL